MKKLSETLTELGIAFSYPIEINDSNGNETYCEESNGDWWRSEYDSNWNETYHEGSNGFWYKKEYDANGNMTYYEDSDGDWCKREYGANGNETYHEDSDGVKKGTPESARTYGRVVEVDGIKYTITAL